MPISISKLMADCPSTEEDQVQSVNLARSVGERLSQQMEPVASLMKAIVEPRYFSPPAIPLPMQRQPTTIVITLTIDVALQE